MDNFIQVEIVKSQCYITVPTYLGQGAGLSTEELC